MHVLFARRITRRYGGEFYDKEDILGAKILAGVWSFGAGSSSGMGDSEDVEFYFWTVLRNSR